MEEDEEIIVKGTYDLKNLSLFSKCQNMCNNIEMFFKNNFPLIIKYQVAKDKGFEIFEIWSDVSYLDNIEFCKKIIRERI